METQQNTVHKTKTPLALATYPDTLAQQCVSCHYWTKIGKIRYMSFKTSIETKKDWGRCRFHGVGIKLPEDFGCVMYKKKVR